MCVLEYEAYVHACVRACGAELYVRMITTTTHIAVSTKELVITTEAKEDAGNDR